MRRKQLPPLLRIKPQRKLPIAPIHQRAFDDAVLHQHQCGCARIIRQCTRLRRRIQPAPGRALAIEQCFAPQRVQPLLQHFWCQALFFEIVPGVGHAVFLQPVAGFLTVSHWLMPYTTGVKVVAMPQIMAVFAAEWKRHSLGGTCLFPHNICHAYSFSFRAIAAVA